MHVAGPIANREEADALEQVAYLFDLKARLVARRKLPLSGPRPPRSHRSL